MNLGGTILGTSQFMSPEIYNENPISFYGYEVDIWAFGVLFYFMLNMEFPFSNLLPIKKSMKTKLLKNGTLNSKKFQKILATLNLLRKHVRKLHLTVHNK